MSLTVHTHHLLLLDICSALTCREGAWCNAACLAVLGDRYLWNIDSIPCEQFLSTKRFLKAITYNVCLEKKLAGCQEKHHGHAKENHLVLHFRLDKSSTILTSFLWMVCHSKTKALQFIWSIVHPA